MRIPYELLTELANSLLNDTVFEIVKGLMEIQHVTEKHLLQLRQQVLMEHERKDNSDCLLANVFGQTRDYLILARWVWVIGVHLPRLISLPQ